MTNHLVALPNRIRKPVSEIQPGMVLFLHVDRWNGFYNIPVDSVEAAENSVSVKSGEHTHRLFGTVLVYEKYPWWV